MEMNGRNGGIFQAVTWAITTTVVGSLGSISQPFLGKFRILFLTQKCLSLMSGDMFFLGSQEGTKKRTYIHQKCQDLPGFMQGFKLKKSLRTTTFWDVGLPLLTMDAILIRRRKMLPTLPETNRSHLNIDVWKNCFLLGYHLVRCYCIFRKGNNTNSKLPLCPLRIPTQSQ